MAKKGESFAIEKETLEKARAVLEKPDLTPDETKEAYANLLEEYDKLLGEARFLTKISDKLETKLNKANDQLRGYNEDLAQSADVERKRSEKARERSKRLAEEKTELDKQRQKVQMLVIMLVALLVVVVVLVVWLFFLGGLESIQAGNA